MYIVYDIIIEFENNKKNFQFMFTKRNIKLEKSTSAKKKEFQNFI